MEPIDFPKKPKKLKSAELGHWLKIYLSMDATKFSKLDQINFTVIQKIAYNYAKEAQSSTSIADKAMKIVKDYDSSWFAVA